MRAQGLLAYLTCLLLVCLRGGLGVSVGGGLRAALGGSLLRLLLLLLFQLFLLTGGELAGLTWVMCREGIGQEGTGGAPAA